MTLTCHLDPSALALSARPCSHCVGAWTHFTCGQTLLIPPVQGVTGHNLPCGRQALRCLTCETVTRPSQTSGSACLQSCAKRHGSCRQGSRQALHLHRMARSLKERLPLCIHGTLCPLAVMEQLGVNLNSPIT